jgi:hypothetical protein
MNTDIASKSSNSEDVSTSLRMRFGKHVKSLDNSYPCSSVFIRGRLFFLFEANS